MIDEIHRLVAGVLAGSFTRLVWTEFGRNTAIMLAGGFAMYYLTSPEWNGNEMIDKDWVPIKGSIEGWIEAVEVENSRKTLKKHTWIVGGFTLGFLIGTKKTDYFL